MSDETVPDVDWAPFDKQSEDTATCRCGAIWRTHHKLVSTGSSFVGVTRKSCPSCGSSLRARQVSSDPETWDIRG